MIDSTHRTGEIGNCTEYTIYGYPIPGQDQRTIAGLIETSVAWPDTYHQYRNQRGYVTWARAGREVPPPPFAR